MKSLVALAAGLMLAASTGMVAGVAMPSAVQAQSNDNDYTPLNSRIRRDRQFPTAPLHFVDPAQLGAATRDRGQSMEDQFARCIYDRSNEKALDLLARTDFGFNRFDQIGLANNEVMDRYPIQTCLRRVTRSHQTGARLRYTPASMREWYLQEAYLDAYPDGATWAVAGNVIGERSYPLSANNPAVRSVMDFSDCVVAQSPSAADLFFRTAPGSELESQAISNIVPLLSACIPDGQQLDISPQTLRLWIGESLWHAANNNAPAPAENPQEVQ